MCVGVSVWLGWSGIRVAGEPVDHLSGYQIFIGVKSVKKSNTTVRFDG
jgi:hypothetical protein